MNTDAHIVNETRESGDVSRLLCHPPGLLLHPRSRVVDFHLAIPVPSERGERSQNASLEQQIINLRKK